MSAQFWVSVAVILVVVQVILLSCNYLILLERKLCAWVQDRIGPNRVNFSFGVLPIKHHNWGLGQPLADGLKLFLKEDYTPPGVDRGLFMLAPLLAVVPAMIAWAVMPWGGYWHCDGFSLNLPLIGQWTVKPFDAHVTAAPINIGVIYVLAIGSLAVYGVTIAGYASNNKYSFLGGLRATAQMLSYEIPMGLCVLIIILVSASARADLIVLPQAAGVWNIIQHPLLAIIFFTCVLAECNRAPFDLAEAEQELVGGFHTEYASMKWALFFLGEYIHMITGAAFFALLFLGGWDVLPFVNEGLAVTGLGLVFVKFGIFFGKVVGLVALMMLVRWTFPRFRFDQLMRLAWRSLIPVTLVLLLTAGVIVYLDLSPWWHLAANVAVLVGVMAVAPLIPQGPPVNRRVPLPGSRFNPA